MMSKQDYPSQPPPPTQPQPIPPYPPGPTYQSGQPVYVQAGQPIIMQTQIWGTNPQPCTCPNCKNSIVTRLVHETGTGTWIIAGGLCLFGFWCGCQFLPFCIDGCKDVQHYCPNCNTLLGTRPLIR